MKFCEYPFRYIEVSTRSDGSTPCYTCCPTILPNVVGDLSESSLTDIWNSDEYIKIRESILDGSFRYCNHDLCPEIQSGAVVRHSSLLDGELWDIVKNKKTFLDYGPKIINLAYDKTCNLSCPSCRDQFIVENSPLHDKKLELTTQRILEGAGDAERIIACSSGDPFSSKHYQKLLTQLNFTQHEHLKIQIVTNGVLFDEERWNSISNIHGRIEMICISIDASNEATYNVVRRGGNWNRLMKNLEFISKLRSEGEIPFVRLDFVVQNANYREMPAFIDMCESLNFDQVFFQKIVNWGSFSDSQFLEHAVYLEDHCDHQNFLSILDQTCFKRPIVNMGNLSHFVLSDHLPPTFSLKNAVKHSALNLSRKFQLWFKNLIF